MTPTAPRLTQDDWRAARITLTLQQFVEYEWRFHVLVLSDVPLAKIAQIHDVQIQMAVLESLWLRARILIEFLLGGGRGKNKVTYALYMPSFQLPKELRKRLTGYRTQVSHWMLHLLEGVPDGTGYARAMPDDVIEAFGLFVDALESARHAAAPMFRQQFEMALFVRTSEQSHAFHVSLWRRGLLPNPGA